MERVSRKTDIMSIQLYLFHFITIICYMLLAISIINKSKDATNTLNNIEFYFRIYISLYLIWRFNPYRKKTKLTELDNQMIFSSAFFLLVMILLHKYLIKYALEIKNYFINFNKKSK